MHNPWGDEQTRYFYELTPDKIFKALQSQGVQTTGHCSTMFSMENRVYDVEFQFDKEPANRWEHHRILKFYRPGRWNQQQILDEHQFLADLDEAEVPVVKPEKFANGSTLALDEETGLYFTVFPRVGGRTPDEFSPDMLQQMGRFMARMHAVGKQRSANHRITINPDSYGANHLKKLLTPGVMPLDLHDPYKDVVMKIVDKTRKWFEESEIQRIHGDCHRANILLTPEGTKWIDFDDMLMGPCVQDMWLLIPGFEEPGHTRELFLEAYESMHPFDRKTLRLIEPLRALRFIHFSAWIAHRWQDPVFSATFPDFGTRPYWQEQITDLNEQLAKIESLQE